MDLKKGVICKLTNDVANFQSSCDSFEKDTDLKETSNTSLELPKDNSKRARIAINVFWAICFVNLIAVLSGYFEFELLQKINYGENYTDNEIYSNDLRQAIIGFTQSFLYIAALIVFLNWFRRAYANLHRIGVKNLEYEDTMAIWGFIIPIANLQRPLKIAREILTETVNSIKLFNPNYRQTANSYIIGAWWALFLISNVIGEIAFKSVFKEDTVGQIINSTIAYMASDFLDIPAAFLTILMIKQLSEEEFTLQKNFATT
jgi:hypothetical protein